MSVWSPSQVAGCTPLHAPAHYDQVLDHHAILQEGIHSAAVFTMAKHKYGRDQMDVGLVDIIHTRGAASAFATRSAAFECNRVRKRAP